MLVISVAKAVNRNVQYDYYYLYNTHPSVLHTSPPFFTSSYTVSACDHDVQTRLPHVDAHGDTGSSEYVWASLSTAEKR